MDIFRLILVTVLFCLGILNLILGIMGLTHEIAKWKVGLNFFSFILCITVGVWNIWSVLN